MTRAARHRPAAWPRRLGAALFGSYTTRFLLSLAGTLLLVGLCFHLPLESAYDVIGWQISPETQRPMIDLIDVQVLRSEGLDC